MGCQASSSGNLYGVVLIVYYSQPKVIRRRRGDEVGGVLLYALVSLYSYLAYGHVGRTCKKHEAGVFGAADLLCRIRDVLRQRQTLIRRGGAHGLTVWVVPGPYQLVEASW